MYYQLVIFCEELSRQPRQGNSAGLLATVKDAFGIGTIEAIVLLLKSNLWFSS